MGSHAGRKCCLILRNTLINSEKIICEPITDPIPEIFNIYKNFLYNDKGGEWNMDEKGLQIRMMDPTDNDYYKGEKGYIENEDGCLFEYNRKKPREEIETVLIEDYDCCGNYIIGSLLKETYPNLTTIMIDRYRGWASHVIDGHYLQIRNFIALSTQGNVNPFDYIRKLPTIENALFSDEDCYFDSYYMKDFDLPKRGFKEEFEDCLKVAIGLKTLLFFVELNEPINTPTLYSPPEGWSARTLKFKGPQQYFWICYEKQ